uniref:MYM-type domain-containing protein n=1 Tax=viral metagenome TaxID=1070528 RepID=A0A6C0E2Y3_9ZZZZ
MINQEIVIKPKRGRKPKSENACNLNVHTTHDPIVNNDKPIQEAIHDSDNCIMTLLTKTDISSDISELCNDASSDNNILHNLTNTNAVSDNPPSTLKKRGRKPKGGKIIQHLTPAVNQKNIKPTIILHLKCSLRDLMYSNTVNNIESYHFMNKGELSYNMITNDSQTLFSQNNETDKYTDSSIDTDYTSHCRDKDNETKELWKKIKRLEHSLHINNISDKKSACFWCTYTFDNPAIHIPKHYIKNAYEVYGCFCSPECAVAYLMEENIDSSAKFERYHFINYIYGKIYQYNKNIKPAPNPYYMLDKYYGNMTIQEYRSLFNKERLFLIVDKPLTRVLPELHEDNDDFILNNKIIPSNNYQLKKQSNKKTNNSKHNILNETFGIASG